MTGATYELAMNIIGVFNVISIAVQAVYTTEKARRLWIISEITLNFVFFFELIADIWI